MEFQRPFTKTTAGTGGGEGEGVLQTRKRGQKCGEKANISVTVKNGKEIILFSYTVEVLRIHLAPPMRAHRPSPHLHLTSPSPTLGASEEHLVFIFLSC